MSEFFKLSRHDLTVEDFGNAAICDGVVYSWIHRPHVIRTDFGCWGYTVYVPGDSYVRTGFNRSSDPVYQPSPTEYVIDDVDVCIEIIRFSEESPDRLEFIRHTGADVSDAPPYTSHALLLSEFHWHREGKSVVIDDCVGDQKTILIPDRLLDSPVLRVELDDTFLPQGCETFIVSQGVKQVDVRFDDNMFLSRLEIPDSVELLSPPDHVSFNFWFLHKPAHQPVYLCGYYCGTPGGGCGKDSELVIRNGTIGIAGCADFRNYWHRIHIPDSVTYIGCNAFAFSNCLEEVRLPDQLITLGDASFMSCPRLTRLSLPASLDRPIAAFQCSYALEEVSMPANCYSDDSPYFSKTPRFLLRHGQRTEVISSNALPDPVYGSFHAFSSPGPFTAGGKDYASTKELTKNRVSKDGQYYDCHGRTVLHLRLADPQLLTSGGESYYEDHWYLHSAEGLTQVVDNRSENILLVWDNIPADQICAQLRAQVCSVFPIPHL